VENFWAVASPLRTPLGNSQRTSRNPAGEQGIAAPLEQSHTRCRPSDPVMGSNYYKVIEWKNIL